MNFLPDSDVADVAALEDSNEAYVKRNKNSVYEGKKIVSNVSYQNHWQEREELSI